MLLDLPYAMVFLFSKPTSSWLNGIRSISNKLRCTDLGRQPKGGINLIPGDGKEVLVFKDYLGFMHFEYLLLNIHR